MKVHVKYFASVREAVGKGAETVETKAETCGALRDELVARSGGYAQALARGKAVRIAIDQVMSAEDAPLHESCEVAFFPPVTGG